MPRSYLDPDIGAQLPSGSEMASCDRAAIESGTAALELMQRAGHAVFDALVEVLFEEPQHLDHVLVLCGPGNNGGDGLVVAQKLREKGQRAICVLASSPKYSSDCRIQVQRALWSGVEVYLYGGQSEALQGLELKLADSQALKGLFESSVVFVDALLGTGQIAAPRGELASLLKEFLDFAEGAAQRPFVISVDVPTGANCDNGQVYTPCIRADLTVCIEALKRGLLQSPARERCGRLTVAPIGIEVKSCEFELLRRDTVRPLPGRSFDFHKGSAGHVLIVAGSKNMPGAAALAGAAALRSGAGLVSVAALSGVEYSLLPELMRVDCGEGQCFASAHAQRVTSIFEKVDALVLGPGIGRAAESGEFVKSLLAAAARVRKPTVIDADALNLIAERSLSIDFESAVITPHPGEAARLLGAETSLVQADRYDAARRLSERFRCKVVLKGGSSVVKTSAGAWVNSSGNPFMATAGSGDVLSGMLGGIMAQANCLDFPLDEAVKYGVFLHGVAGDLAHAQLNGPIISSDIIAQIPRAFGYGA